MCFCEYVGNGVKDLICAPRPMGHPKGGQTKLLLSAKGGKDDARVHSLVSRALPYMLSLKAFCPLKSFTAWHPSMLNFTIAPPIMQAVCMNTVASSMADMTSSSLLQETEEASAEDLEALRG